jgi:RNA recognition motif-containing protein
LTCTKAYISGIRNEHNESDLANYFSKFGEIESVEIIVDHVTREKRGFAFVVFKDYDSVDRVVCEYFLKFMILQTLE